MRTNKCTASNVTTARVSACWLAGWCVGFVVSSANAGQTFFDQQWALKNVGQVACDMRKTDCKRGTPGSDIKAEYAWAKITDCTNVLVAVLDTGADFSHPDLRDNLVPGVNFTAGASGVSFAFAPGGSTILAGMPAGTTPGARPSGDATDDNLHGTHVSGTVAAAGRSVYGICRRAKIIPVKIASAEGRLTDSDIISGIQFAASKGARVINASFGGYGYSEAIKSAIAKASNTLIVAAAGNASNNNDTRPSYPASYGLPNIISVAATDNQDQLAKFSNIGAKSVHIAAPGVGIMSTLPMKPTAPMKSIGLSAGYGSLDGTSMAAPHVAGAAAMLLAKSPRMPIAVLRAQLIGTSDAVPSLKGKVGGGRLNLARLLQ